jgi:NADPH2:quinone reductase
MKAIRVHAPGGPEVLRLEDVPSLSPGPRQIVVQVEAAGVNPVETYIRTGNYGLKPPLPYTPGFDAGGTVKAVGQAVSAFKPGDRVYTSGTVSGSYAEEALCEEAQVHPLPAKISFAQGAAVGAPYSTAYRALLQRGRAVAGEVVLVHGASGGVGIAAVQLARAAGLTVLGTAGSEQGLRLIGEQGTHHAFDHRTPDYLEKIRAVTDGRGVDVILEMLANVNLAKDLSLLARFGRVVVIGSRGSAEINPREAMTRDADILGMTLFNVSESELAGIHAALGAGLENGTLRPVIGQEIPLAEAPRAHQAIMEPGALGKIVLIP